MNNYVSLKYKNNKIGYLLFILSFLSFGFISAFPAILTFDVPFPAIYIFVLLHFVSTLILWRFRNLRIPYFPIVMLCLRLFLFIIQAINLSISAGIIAYEIEVTVVSIYLFVCAYNFTSDDQREIRIMLISFALLATVQVCASAIANGGDKDMIMAGIGMSNYVATFILMSFSYILFSIKSKWDYVWVLIFLFGIMLTQSFGAYISTAVLVIIKIKKSFNWHQVKSWIILLLMILAVIISYLVLRSTSIGAPIVSKIETKLAQLFGRNYMGFGSSRLSLYGFTLDNISRHWFLGPIVNVNPYLPIEYEWQEFSAHNFLLESLVKYGVLGSIINAIVLVYILKRAAKALKYCPGKIGIIYIFIGAMIHGFIEPNFFTLHFEMFYWCLCGALLSPIGICEEAKRKKFMQCKMMLCRKK